MDIVLTDSIIEDFFGRARSVAVAARQAETAIARAIAPKFRAINLFDPKETDLSRVIAFLLDPNGDHGQGTAFLEQFLKAVGLKELMVSSDPIMSLRNSIKVWTEDVFETGRSDIRIDYRAADGLDFHVLIENKPWAIDGVKQIERYAEHMKKKYTENWCIVYIPRNEGDPREHSINSVSLKKMSIDGHYFLLPYSAPGSFQCLESWLKTCAEVCEAPRPKNFIEELLIYIDENVSNQGAVIMSEAEKTTAEIMLKFLSGLKDDFFIALQVDKALRALRVHLANEIANRIVEGVKSGLGDEWQQFLQPSDDKHAGITFRKKSWRSGPRNLAISAGVQFQQGNWKEPLIGLSAHEDILSEDDRGTLQKALTAKFPDMTGRTVWWVACKKCPFGIPPDWMSDDFLNFARQATIPGSRESESVNNLIEKIKTIAKITDDVLSARTDS